MFDRIINDHITVISKSRWAAPAKKCKCCGITIYIGTLCAKCN